MIFDAFNMMFSSKEITKLRRPALIVILSLCCFSIESIGQDYETKRKLQDGVERYEDQSYLHAIHDFEELIDDDSSYVKAVYNLGNSYFREGDYEGALQLYRKLDEAELSQQERATVLHNRGSAELELAKTTLEEVPGEYGFGSPEAMQAITKSIGTLKQALRHDPNADDTRYNLALAQRLFKEYNPPPPPEQEQEEQQSGGDQEDQEGGDQPGGQQQQGEEEAEGQQGDEGQEQEGPDGEKNQDEQGQGEGQEQEGESQEGEGQPQSPGEPSQEMAPPDGSSGQTPMQQSPKSLSPEEMRKRMLRMQMERQDEKEAELQKKMAKQRMSGSGVKGEKDW